MPNDRGMTDAAYLVAVDRLLTTIQELTTIRQMLAVQRIVTEAARDIAGCDGTTFVLLEDAQCYYAEEDAIAPLWKGKRFPLESCISGWVMLNRHPAAIPDIYADSRVPHDAYRPTFVRSLVMVPIRSDDPIGAVGSYWASYHEASEREIGLLQSLADAASLAIENAQLYADLHKLATRAAAATENSAAKRRLLSGG